MQTFDAVIVGGGIMGTACAYYLSLRGQRVALLDQYDIPNPWAASGDHARIFRYTYGKDTFYTELAVRSLALWKEFQKEIREEVYTDSGMVDLAVKEDGYEADCYRALVDRKLPVYKLGPSEVRERFRIFNPKAFRYAVFHPDGGMLWAERAVGAFARAAMRRQAKIQAQCKVAAVVKGKEGIHEVRDAAGHIWKGSVYVFASGPWSPQVLARYHLPLKVTRQQLLYFRPPLNQGRFRPGHCPVFACLSKGYYGLPAHIHGFMKMGHHRRGSAGRPGPGPQEITPRFEKGCREFLKSFIPDLYGFVDFEGKICFYNSTPDDDFIIDRLPNTANAFVATGFSGHGFKFGPLVGTILADLITRGKSEINLTRFRAGRFGHK